MVWRVRNDLLAILSGDIVADFSLGSLATYYLVSIIISSLNIDNAWPTFSSLLAWLRQSWILA